ncbi:MAG: hypothetical protein ACD_23C00141G0004 [uncultured bacterium]|nr:MAG: hypothetical protein ACD_23C00141G0004 [uncultured bacterium]
MQHFAQSPALYRFKHVLRKMNPLHTHLGYPILNPLCPHRTQGRHRLPPRCTTFANDVTQGEEGENVRLLQRLQGGATNPDRNVIRGIRDALNRPL